MLKNLIRKVYLLRTIRSSSFNTFSLLIPYFSFIKTRAFLIKRKPSESFSVSSPALPGSDNMGISQLKVVKHPLEKDLVKV